MAVDGAWTYTLDGTDATITDYDTGVGGFTPTIPTVLDTDKDVVAVADYAMDNKSLTSLTIGHVIDLGDNCFASNSGMAVNISADITTVAVGAYQTSPFEFCAIADGLTISEGVTILDDYIFASAGVTEVTLPSSLTTIRQYAFYSNSLTALTIPTNTVTISNNAFENNSIASLTLSHIVDLDDNCFKNNSGMALTISVNITTNATGDYRSAPFEACAIADGLTISEGVTIIDDYLFSESGLTEITLPSTLTTIRRYAFNNNSLTALSLPTNTVTLGDNAFTSNSIASLTLSHVISLANNCFYGNSGMALTISADITTNGVTDYRTGPFEACAIADGITISDGVTTIDDYLFAEAGLTEIEFPSTVVTVRRYALYNNDDLSTITFLAKETITFGTNILDGSEPTSKGIIYGYDSSVETWAAGYSTYYDYNTIVDSSYTTNFSNVIHLNGKFSKTLDFFA